MEGYTALTAREICERMLAADSLVFLIHRRPDGDAVGSAAALMHIMKALGKRTSGLCEDKIPERLLFLTEGLSFDTVPQKTDALFVAVDVASPMQLGTLTEALAQKNIHIDLMIDHHAVGEPFAHHLIVPTAAAAGEIVYEIAELLRSDGHLPALPKAAARALYAALSSDTGCFRYSNVTPKTMRTAAALLETEGVDAADINHMLFETKSERQLRAEAFAIEHTDTSRDGKIAWVTVTQKQKESLGVEEEHLETVIDMVRSRAGVEIAVAIRETPMGTFRASLRSSGFDVASVAAVFGGGGHLRAAGCSIDAHTVDEALEAILGEIARQK